ncbi:MAG: GldG family protein, partial [Woeseiaceae bacterium]
MSSYRSFGLFGTILLTFGLLGGFITSSWNSRYVLVHLIGGGALLVIYLFTHLESLRESVQGRRAQLGTNTVVYSVLTIGVLVLINYLGVQHEWRYDATEEAIFSIAPQTRQLLNGLDQDVHIYAFFRENEEQQARELLDSYAAASERFGFTMVDPDKDPALTQEMEVTQYGTLVLTAGEERTRITNTSEQELTNALIRFTTASKKQVYFTVGHGEPELDPRETRDDYGQLKASLENEGYEVGELLLAAVPDVPADAAVLVVAGPQRPFLDHELEVLQRHLDRGGSTMMLIDPRNSEELLPLLEARGIQAGDDVIIDQVMQLFSGPTLGVQPIAADYGFHDITEAFNQRTIYTLARSSAEHEISPLP